MEIIIAILVILVVGALLFYAARLIMEVVKLPQPFHNLILALILIIVALWVASRAGLI